MTRLCEFDSRGTGVNAEGISGEMTYAGFLLVFLVVPLVILAALLRRRLSDRRFLVLTGALMLIALIYMAPWDHTAAVWGLWTWAHGRTWGLRWWAVPPEEYLFCLLEALLAATLTYALLLWRERSRTTATVGEDSTAHSTESEAAR